MSALPGLSLRVAACRYAATLMLQAAGNATEADVDRAYADLTRAAEAHAHEVGRFVRNDYMRRTGEPR